MDVTCCNSLAKIGILAQMPQDGFSVAILLIIPIGFPSSNGETPFRIYFLRESQQCGGMGSSRCSLIIPPSFGWTTNCPHRHNDARCWWLHCRYHRMSCRHCTRHELG